MYYKIDPNKLGPVISSYEYILGAIEIPEDYEHIDHIRHLLVNPLPERRKTLTEIQTDLEQRIDYLVLDLQRKHKLLQGEIELKVKESQRRQREKFEYLKKWGHFPRITLLTGESSIVNSSMCSGTFQPNIRLKPRNKLSKILLQALFKGL